MSGIHVSPMGDAHGYTRSRVPWTIDESRDEAALSDEGRRIGFRLFKYISGGGMRTFGKTVEQVDRERRQSRFLAVAAVLAAVWLAVLAF